MSMKYLGESFDIHTGGIDHIPVHHPNEIAQSEAATGKPFVKYWIHHAFLTVDGKKMSKSLGNYYTIEDVIQKNFDPSALRYFYLTAHYRKPLNFTWEALTAAQNALSDLRSKISQSERTALSQEKLEKIDSYRSAFDAALSDDLNMPAALAAVWAVVKSNISAGDKYELLIDFDEVLGLDLSRQHVIPEEIRRLVREREELRKQSKFEESDDIRKEIEASGYTVEDSPTGSTAQVRVKRP